MNDTQTIKSSAQLASMMATKAVLMREVFANILKAPVEEKEEGGLHDQYAAFKELLIHDIKPEDFADIYAETIAYAMFAARLHDSTLDNFSRQEALELLPKSNPFLHSLFGYIAGPELDDRVKWIIDDLAAVFQAANVKKLMEGFGKLTGQNDPFLHFYETFLAAYNPAKRKARGVWYTPEPVVNFIVRAVDEVLQTEFGLPDGLADTSKVTIDWDTGETKAGKAVTIKKEVHRVQILDPATGTGTFLAEVIKQIAPKVKDVAEGMWSPYIERDLIPRLHGFELLMASYAMCHMKLDMILTEMGYKPTGTPPRLGVYLTNSLEEGERDVRDLFMAQWLTREVREANTVKRQTPIMCVIGNPPYSGESTNKGDWIMGLMEAYKKEPGGKEKLRERNPKWINDDYVKFIRFAEHLIEKTGEGVLGFITNHGYLDNPTFRGMRWHLLNTFEKIYILDLHGNTKKKEVTPEGKPDKNVFDIQQGVSIIIGIKHKAKSAKTTLGLVLHANLWGSRESKYSALQKLKLSASDFLEVTSAAPFYQFHPRDFASETRFNEGFNLKGFFIENVLGFQTHRDGFAVSDSETDVRDKLNSFISTAKTDAELHRTYGIKDNRDWKLGIQRSRIRLDSTWQEKITKCLYRPFDTKYCHLDYITMNRPRTEIIRNNLNRENLSLLASRQLALEGYFHCLVTDLPAESCAISLKTKEQNQVFSLYSYATQQDLDQTRRVNFEPKLYQHLQTLAKHPTYGTPDEVQTFDYIYGVLHCPAYRATYAEFLKIDFPRIPWPATPDEFWDISAKGQTLRKLHLMDPATIGPAPYPFKGEGNAVVEKPEFRDGKVWINQTQCFDAAPEVSWGFYIGGYQPAQKWLKDRKTRALTFDDVKHYQRILKILSETARIMATITMTLDTGVTAEA